MSKKFYEFRNAAAPDCAELIIYDEIGSFGLTARDFYADLKTVTAPKLCVRINSPGGDVQAGLGIYNLLCAWSGEIECVIDGIAASMASVIAMAGDTVTMAENAMMMIHNPTGGVYGDSDEMRQMAEVMDKIKDSIVLAYTKKSGQSADKIAELMNAETWLSASEAKDLGLCDNVADTVEATAKAHFKIADYFPKFPAKNAAALNSRPVVKGTPAAPPAPSQPSNPFAMFKEIHAEFGKDASKLQLAMDFAAANEGATLEAIRAHVTSEGQKAELTSLKNELEGLKNSHKEALAAKDGEISRLTKANADLSKQLATAKGAAGAKPVDTGAPAAPVNEPATGQLKGLARAKAAHQADCAAK